MAEPTPLTEAEQAALAQSHRSPWPDSAGAYCLACASGLVAGYPSAWPCPVARLLATLRAAQADAQAARAVLERIDGMAWSTYTGTGSREGYPRISEVAQAILHPASTPGAEVGGE
jgi:hypothetical protein